ncbi:hypothetical protein MTO96_045052 [Rhipicephalus appendiculatus]
MLPMSGEFEVCESGAVVAKGRIRMAQEGEKVLLNEPPDIAQETVSYDMDSADVYKELRLRGYGFYGAFQGVLKGHSKKPCTKLKWENNWVTFLDALIHFGSAWNPQRTFDLPVTIQSCRIDPKVQVEMMEVVGENGLDAVYCPYLNMRRAGGVEVEGLKLISVPRRPIEQVPVLEEYSFVPYQDNEVARCEREHIVREYADVCCDIVLRAFQHCGKYKKFTGMVNGCRELPEKILDGYAKNTPSNYGLFELLLNMRNHVHGSATLAETVKSSILNSRKTLEEDLLNSSLLAGDPLRCLLDIVAENTSFTRLRVLEVAVDGNVTLMTPWVFSLLSLYDRHLKTAYSIIHPSPEGLSPDQVPKGAAVVAQDNSLSAEKLPKATLVLASCGIMTTSGDLLTLPKRIFCHCEAEGFVLVSHRTTLTAAERLLSKVSGVPFQVYSEDATRAAFRACGFHLVGLKSNNLSVLLLFRKVTLPIEVSRQVVINVRNSTFNWVETLKEKVAEYIHKPARENIWLLSEDAGINGIVGLTNCLLQETGGRLIRCVFDATTNGGNKVADFSPSNPAYKDIIENDLVMNVTATDSGGCFRHRTMDWCGEAKTATQLAYLHFKTRGDFSSLQWYESPLRYISPSHKTAIAELICDVYYATVDFRDVMIATGQINHDGFLGYGSGDGTFLGTEFSGRDLNGRRVMGIVGGKSIATVLVADPVMLWEVPEAWTLEEAATVPVAYSTAYYALVVQGDIQSGESILVHSGSGGVGQAAISLALSMACTVYTTVGSEKERDFLKGRFPQLEDRHFASSRDRSFEEHIKMDTRGQGVDLVLNSLAGEMSQASVRCLAPHGRFLEIGHSDLSEDSNLGTSSSLRNVSFRGATVYSLLHDNLVTQVHKRRVAELVRKGIASSVVRPLGVVSFTRDQTEQAFRSVASGEQIGKTVIQVRQEETQLKPTKAPTVTLEAVARPCFYEHKSYVIVFRTGYQRLCLHRWSSLGATVLVSKEDVSTEEGARKVIDNAVTMGPVGGIFNLAVVLHDAIIENQSAETYKEVYRPKVLVTQRLDDISRERCPCLDHFVVFSSFASGRGNAGQTNYAFANSVMERLCERRAEDGLPGLAIQWGAVGDVGVFHEKMGANVTVAGLEQQPIRSCMAVMDVFLSQSHPVVTSFVRSSSSPTVDGKQKKRSRSNCAAHPW